MPIFNHPDYSSEDDEVDIANMTERHKRKLEALLAAPVEWSDDDGDDAENSVDDEQDGDSCLPRRKTRIGSNDNDDLDAIAMSINILRPDRSRGETDKGNISFLEEANATRTGTSLSVADELRKRRGDADSAMKAIDAAVKKDQSFSLRELKKLRRIFESFDEEGGMIFRVFVELVGPIIRHKAKGASLYDMEVLFKRIDANANGSVDWFEISDFLLMNDIKTSARAIGGAGHPQQFEREAVSGQSAFDHPATRFLYHSEPATRLLINHRYGHYYTSSTDGTAKMWDPNTSRHERTFHYSKSPIVDLVQTSWDDNIGVLAMDGTASFYSADSGDLVRVYRAEKRREVGTIGGSRGIVDDRRGYIHRPVFTVPISTHEMESIRYGDETRSFGRIDACAPHLSHFVKDEQIETVGLENLGWLPRAAMSKGALLYANGTNSIVHYDPSAFEYVGGGGGRGGSFSANASSLVSAGYVSSMATFSDSRAEKATKVIFGLESGHLQLYDIDAPSSFGLPIAVPNKVTLAAHTGLVSSIKVCESMNLLFTASYDGTLQVRHWDRLEDFGVRLGEGVLTTATSSFSGGSMYEGQPSFRDVAQRGHTRRVTAMDWSLRSRILGSCGPERDALIWSPYLPKPIMKLEGEPMSHMVDIRFCDATGQVITLSSNRTVKLWDIRTYRCIHTLRDGGRGGKGCRERDGLQVAAFDSKRSAVVLGTTFPRQWMVVKNTRYGSAYNGHRLPIVGMALSVQFGQLITADSKYIIVWDAVYQTVIVRWRVADGITGITLDTNGRRLLVSTLQGTVLVYNYVNAQLLKQCYPTQPPTVDFIDAIPSKEDMPTQRTTQYERPWVQQTEKSGRRAAAVPEKSAEEEAAAALAPESEHEAKGHEWEVDVEEQLILHDDPCELTGDTGSTKAAAVADVGKSTTSLSVSRKPPSKQETRFVHFGELLHPHRQYLFITGMEDGTAVIYPDNDTAVSYPTSKMDTHSMGGAINCALFISPSLLILGVDGVLIAHTIEESISKAVVMPLLSQQQKHTDNDQPLPVPSDVCQTGPDRASTDSRSLDQTPRSISLHRPSMASPSATVHTKSIQRPSALLASPPSPSPPSLVGALSGGCKVALYEGPLTDDPLPANRRYLETRDAIIISAAAKQKSGLPSATAVEGGVSPQSSLSSGDVLVREQLPSIDVMLCVTAVEPFVLITGSSDGLIQFWSGRTMEERFRFRATLVSGDAVTALTSSVDGCYLGVGDSSGYISVFDIRKIIHHNRVEQPAHHDGLSFARESSDPFAASSSRGVGYDTTARHALGTVSQETMKAFAFVGQTRQVKKTTAISLIEEKAKRRQQQAEHDAEGGAKSFWASAPDIFINDSMILLTKRFRAHDGAIISLVRLDTSAQSNEKNVLRRDNPEAFVRERDADYISGEADRGRLRYLYSGGADSFVYLWDVVDVQGISCVGDSTLTVNPLKHTEKATAVLDACRRRCLALFIELHEQGVTRRMRAEFVAAVAEERAQREEAKAQQLLSSIAFSPLAPDGATLGQGLVKHGRRIGSKRQEEAERRRQEELDTARFNAIRYEGASLAVLEAFVTACVLAFDAPSAEEDAFKPVDASPSLALETDEAPSSSRDDVKKKAADDLHLSDVPEDLQRTTAHVFTSVVEGGEGSAIPALVKRIVKEMLQPVHVDYFLNATGLHTVVTAQSLTGDGVKTYQSNRLPAELLKVSVNPAIAAAEKDTSLSNDVSANAQNAASPPDAEGTRYLLNPLFHKEAALLLDGGGGGGRLLSSAMLVGITDWSKFSVQNPFAHLAQAAPFAASGSLTPRTPLSNRPLTNNSVSAGGNNSGAAMMSVSGEEEVEDSADNNPRNEGGASRNHTPSKALPATMVITSAEERALQIYPQTASDSNVSVAVGGMLTPPEPAFQLSGGVTPPAASFPRIRQPSTAQPPLQEGVSLASAQASAVSGHFISATPEADNMLAPISHGNKSFVGGGAQGGGEEGGDGVRYIARPPRYHATGRGRMRDGIGRLDGSAAEKDTLRDVHTEDAAAFDVTVSEPNRSPKGSQEDGRLKIKMPLLPTNSSARGEDGGEVDGTPRLTNAERTALLTRGYSSGGIAIEALTRGTAVVARLLLKFGTAAMKARYLPLLVGTKTEGPKRLGAFCVLDADSADPLVPLSTTLQEGGSVHDAHEEVSAVLDELGVKRRRQRKRQWVLKGSKVCLAENEHTQADPRDSDEEGGGARRPFASLHTRAVSGGSGSETPDDGKDRPSATEGTLFVVLAKGPLRYQSTGVARYPKKAAKAKTLAIEGEGGTTEGNAETNGPEDEGSNEEGRDPNFPLTLLLIDSVECGKKVKFTGRHFSSHNRQLTHVSFADVVIDRPSLQVLGAFEDGRRITVEVLNHIRMGLEHRIPSVNAVVEELLRSAEEVAALQRERRDRAAALEAEQLVANRDDTGAELPLMARLLAADLGILQKARPQKQSPSPSAFVSKSKKGDGEDEESEEAEEGEEEAGPQAGSPSHSGLRAQDIRLLRNLGIAPSFISADEAEVLGGDSDALLTPREKEQRRLLVRDVLKFVTTDEPSSPTESARVTPLSSPRRRQAAMSSSRASIPLLNTSALTSQSVKPSAPSSARRPTMLSRHHSGGKPSAATTPRGTSTATALCLSPRGGASYVSSAHNGDVFAMQSSIRDMRQMSLQMREQYFKLRQTNGNANWGGGTQNTQNQRSNAFKKFEDTTNIANDDDDGTGSIPAPVEGIESDAQSPHATATAPTLGFLSLLEETDKVGDSKNVGAGFFTADPTIFGEDPLSTSDNVPGGVSGEGMVPDLLGVSLNPNQQPLGGGAKGRPSKGGADQYTAATSKAKLSFTDLIQAEADAIRGAVLLERKERLLAAMGSSAAPTTLTKASSNVLHPSAPYDDVVGAVDALAGKGSLWDTSDKTLANLQEAKLWFMHGEEYMAQQSKKATLAAKPSLSGPDTDKGVPILYIHDVPLLGEEGPNVARRASVSSRRDVPTKPVVMSDVRQLAAMSDGNTVTSDTLAFPAEEDDDEEMLRNADDYFEKVIGVRLLQRQMEVGNFVTDANKRTLIGLPPYVLTDGEMERYQRGFLLSDITDKRDFLPTSSVPNAKKMLANTPSDTLLQRLSERRRINDGDPPSVEGTIRQLGAEHVSAPNGNEDPRWLSRIHSQLDIGPSTLAMPPRPAIREEDGGGLTYQQYTSREAAHARESAWLKLLTNPQRAGAGDQRRNTTVLRTSRPPTRDQTVPSSVRIPRPPPKPL